MFVTVVVISCFEVCADYIGLLDRCDGNICARQLVHLGCCLLYRFREAAAVPDAMMRWV